MNTALFHKFKFSLQDGWSFFSKHYLATISALTALNALILLKYCIIDTNIGLSGFSFNNNIIVFGFIFFTFIITTIDFACVVAGKESFPKNLTKSKKYKYWICIFALLAIWSVLATMCWLFPFIYTLALQNTEEKIWLLIFNALIIICFSLKIKADLMQIIIFILCPFVLMGYASIPKITIAGIFIIPIILICFKNKIDKLNALIYDYMRYKRVKNGINWLIITIILLLPLLFSKAIMRFVKLGDYQISYIALNSEIKPHVERSVREKCGAQVADFVKNSEIGRDYFILAVKNATADNKTTNETANKNNTKSAQNAAINATTATPPTQTTAASEAALTGLKVILRTSKEWHLQATITLKNATPNGEKNAVTAAANDTKANTTANASKPAANNETITKTCDFSIFDKYVKHVDY